MFPRHCIHTYIITLIRDSCFKYVDITNYFWCNLCPLIILFLIIQLFVRMCIYFNIGKHKPCCSKRKMRALSLTQEQRRYYHATVAASLIYPVRYIARIPSIYSISSTRCANRGISFLFNLYQDFHREAYLRNGFPMGHLIKRHIVTCEVFRSGEVENRNCLKTICVSKHLQINLWRLTK